MAFEYTIPELLKLSGLRGYTPRLASAVNGLISSRNEIDYDKALKQVTEGITGYQLPNVEIVNATFSDKSHFDGLPIYQPLVFEKLTKSAKDYMLDSAVVSINRTKDIVVTKVQGRDSTVKEFISNGDYQISVTGIIANRGVGYPKADVKEFAGYMSANKSLKITHEVLNMLGVHELVVTDYSLPATEYQNLQTYSFSAISETPVELRIDKR